MILNNIPSEFIKLILSNKKDKSYAYNKAIIVPVLIKNNAAWQLTLYTDKQAFQKNLKTRQEMLDCVNELFQKYYKQLNIFGATQDTEIKISKRDKIMESHHKHTPVCVA